MSEILTQSEIERQVEAHIVRLESRVDVVQGGVSMVSTAEEQRFATVDNIALDQVNNIIKHSDFKKQLCAGLDKTSDDLAELAKPLVRVLLPVSAIKGGTVFLLGYTWTFATLPVGIIGTSLLAIYLARFGIGYFCREQETDKT